MSDEADLTILASGALLEQQHQLAINNSIKVISTAFEGLIILSPDAALYALKQLNTQIRGETVKEMIAERGEYLETLKDKLQKERENPGAVHASELIKEEDE